MDVAQHFRTIWNSRWVVLTAALLAALAVFVWRSNAPATFAAETGVQVVPASNAQGERPGGDDAAFIAEGYAKRATTSPILAQAVEQSGQRWTQQEAEDRVSAAADPASGVVTITATGPTSGDAAALSDAVARALASTVDLEQQQAKRQLLAPLRRETALLTEMLAALTVDDPRRPTAQARLDAVADRVIDIEVQPTDRLAVVSPADPESSAVSPHPSRDALLAFLVMVVLAAEAVVIFNALSDRFSRSELRHDVATTARLPVLADVPSGPPELRRAAFAELRTSLALMTTALDAPSSIAVLGIAPGPGSAETAVGLARAAASASKPVLLVDANMRTPIVHQHLRLALHPGLGNVLAGAALSGRTLRTDPEASNVRVLAAGVSAADPTMAISTHLRERLLEASASRFASLTVINTPPAVPISDAAAIAAQCDLNLLVIDAHATSRRALRDVLDRLRQVGVMPFGIVLHQSPHPASGPTERGPASARTEPTMDEDDELVSAAPDSRLKRRLAVAFGIARPESDNGDARMGEE
jgi:succinoglycan biosynthesis transport protein ExoP